MAIAAFGTVLACAAVGAELPFPEAPAGTYDGPVNTIYTRENAPATPKLDDLELTDTVSQYEITWKLDRKARVGRFLTGDYYVVGPVAVVEITPKPLFGDEVEKAGSKLISQEHVMEVTTYPGKWARNGSMLNPPADPSGAGFDSRIADGFYKPALFQAAPIAMKPGDALVSTISNPNEFEYRGHGQPIQAAAVLTCLEGPVPADAFRPSYCDRAQKIYLARNLKRELLYNLPRPEAAPKDLKQWARAFQRPWFDTVSWGYANPKDNMPRYGQCIMNAISTGAILLHLDYPALEKEQMLVGHVQYGVDLWGIVRAGYPGWPGHGGFGAGRKWVLVFTGMMLSDDAMRDVSKGCPNVHFAEDDQTMAGKSWQGYDVIFESHPAWHPVFSETRPPSEWGPPERMSWDYRMANTSCEWPGEALAAHLMRAEEYFDHDPFFAYVDRWMKEDLVAELKAVRDGSDGGKRYEWTPNSWLDRAITNNYFRRTSPLLQALWDRYRNDLPPANEAAD
jgi:hypothetical protein